MRSNMLDGIIQVFDDLHISLELRDGLHLRWSSSGRRDPLCGAKDIDEQRQIQSCAVRDKLIDTTKLALGRPTS